MTPFDFYMIFNPMQRKTLILIAQLEKQAFESVYFIHEELLSLFC